MNLKPFKDVLTREFGIFFKTPSLLLICIGAPLLFAFMFSALYYNRRAADINIGIVNADNSLMSRKLVRDFDACAELKVAMKPASADEAYKNIFRSDIGAFCFIPKNFSASLKKGQSAPAFNAADASSFIISSNVLKKFSMISMSFSEKQFVKTLTDKGYSYNAAKASVSPLRAVPSYIFNTEMNYSDFLIPVLFFAVLQQILLVSICTTIITDKRPGKRKELRNASKGSFAAAVFGKITPYCCAGMALVAAYAFTALPVNNIFVVSCAGYFFLSTAFIIAVASFAVLISSFFKSQEMAMSVLMFYAMPAVLLSGFAWPRQELPGILKAVSCFLPSTYALSELRLFILGDISVKYALIPAAELLAFAALCFLLSFFLSGKRFGQR